MLLLVSLLMSAPALFGGESVLPAPTGPRPVGTRILYLSDGRRSSPVGDGIAQPGDEVRDGRLCHLAQVAQCKGGEAPDLRLGEGDVLDVSTGELGQAGLDLGRRQPVVVAIPLVEPDGKLADRLIAAPLDVDQDAFDRLSDLRVRPRRPTRPDERPELPG